jgi:transposase-like protein
MENKMARKTNYENGLKFKVALEAIKGESTYEEIATKFNISKSLITKWRDELLKNGSAKSINTTKDEGTEQKLYQQIGQLTMEVDYLKKFLSKYGK